MGVILLVSVLSLSLPQGISFIHRRLFGMKQGVTLESRSMEYYYPKEVRVLVEELAWEVGREPVCAFVHKETGAFIPHLYGLYVDVDATVKRVQGAKKGEALDLCVIEVVPRFLLEDLQAMDVLIGEFSTVLSGSRERKTNIRLSLAALNYTLVHPGETFSFNAVVGERTEEKGYGRAPIILGEEIVQGVGGGICQTSTTLYNAVLRANLMIVERTIHSKAPSYIQHGKDAAVAWPYTDFKFRNTKPYTIMVVGTLDNWRVWVGIKARAL